MEVSRVISRQPPCFPGGSGFGDHQNRSEAFSRSRRIVNGFGVVSKAHTGFRDKGHLRYYYGSEGLVVRCGGKKKDRQTSTKKKLKLLKELSVVPHNDSVDDVQANLIAEATQLLMKQLEQLRAEKKELKKKKKEEKAKLKAVKMKTKLDCESSSSSESSDSECGEVIDMKRLKNEAVAEPIIGELQSVAQEEPTSILPALLTQESNVTEINGFHNHGLGIHGEECCGVQSTSCSNAIRVSCNPTSSSMMSGTSDNRIEVCMGNKCKKSGGVALLEEFERAVGIGGAVVGCKCMGKCRDGPNVRILKCDNEGVADSVRIPAANPLCIGVGLEDVDVIVANFFGKELSVALAT
ncbi:PREDICTED: uncharacterized protein LOC105107189 [Populus euphratica]|uniref:Uncharacterized protein LOC105107189 n=1 Tax=Populus euphratica TaxID=75702 RepID=A0AAJ6SVA2_POPEU|nr:PREDICTED: uncharacterized protein LOC105107189 [Populus euphratica]